MESKEKQGQEPASPLKQIRQEFDMSQSDFAMVLGCSQGYLSEIERGRRSVTRLVSRLRTLHMDADGIAKQQLELVKWNRRRLVHKVRDRARGVG